MDLGLAGKNVVITGGSMGIGRCAALGFAAEGANVAICARGAEALEMTAQEITAMGVRSFAGKCDVGKADQLSEFLDQARAALGSVDILINNTSGFGMSDDEAGWKASVDIDLMASVRASKQVAPWMESAGGGSIVHISSISGLEFGSPPAYAAVKAALVNHAKTMAHLLARKGIRVNCIAPGSIYFEGGFWHKVKLRDESIFKEVVAGIPAGRMGTPEEVADTIVYIASPRANWVSGAVLLVDGVQHKGIF